MSNEKIIILNYPVTIKIPLVNDLGINFDEKIITQVTLRRLKAKDLKKLPEDFIEKGKEITMKEVLPLISIMSDLDISVVEELDVKDLGLIMEEIDSFL